MLRTKLTFKHISIFVISMWLVIFVVWPNLLVIGTSFLERDEVNLIKPIFTLRNYIDLFDPIYYNIFLKTFSYAFVTTTISLLISYPFAFLLSTVNKKFRGFLLILVIIPFWTSSLIRTYALIIILKANGIINTILKAAGFIDKPLQLLYTDFAVYTGLIYSLLPFMILPIYATLERFDKSLIEASFDLGANRLQTFIKVIIPISLPGIIAGCIMVFLPTMGLFYIPDILGGARSMLIGNVIKNQFLTSVNWPFGSAASIFLTFLMLVLLFVYFRIMKNFNISIMDDE